ncbi:AvrE-family type 3 secretion system effector [Pseudomonas sp. TH31]|uniref:AvrE-family type 3 secretion system effector n=1 Tax=Pseudomonas sp. TH31 TaxID=2796396 RepID=UPI001F5B1C45|nr:AvrE-family type 3 secretion system effector [Pseudomonas sp. TH31]
MLFDISLKDGKVQADATVASQYIAGHLNQANKHYVADFPTGTGTNTLRIKDERQHLFYIQSTPAVAAVVKSSRPAETGNGLGQPLNSPGRAHLGLISHVHTTVDGQQYRLENGRLYRFEPQVTSWLPDADNRTLSRLGLAKEGQLLKILEGVADSSAEGRTTVSLSQVQGFSVLRLQRASEQTLRPIDETGEPVELKRIGLTGNTLYGANAHGELLRADLGQARNGVLLMNWQPVESLELALNGAVSVEGFFHDDVGQLNAQIRDSRQQLHSSPLTRVESLRPEWNLSDVLVKGVEQGLPLPSLQALAAVVDLGQRGRLALDAGSLLSWDAVAQRWEGTSQNCIESMERGLDGRGYVLQEGQLKAVATRQVRAPIHEGASYELAAVPAPRTHVVVDEVLAGDSQRRITMFAIADSRTFATVDQDNRLQVHLDGEVRSLALPVPGVQALALDHEGHLYAQSRNGELFRLDHQGWQGHSGVPSSWSKVELPNGQRLDSLRMGADNHLIGGWDNRFYRLGTSAEGKLEWGPVRSFTQAPSQSLAEKLSGPQLRAQVQGGVLSVSSNVMGQTSENIPRNRGFFSGLKSHFHPLDSFREMGLDIQHRFNGRRGLESVYADDKKLHEQLKPLSHAKPVPGNLKVRLAFLSESGPRQVLAKAISDALVRVEKNSEASARWLGEVHGLAFDPKLVLSRASIQPESTLHQLYEAFKRVSPTPAKPTAALLANFEGQALLLPAWDPERKRDRSHPSALIEGNLIHHANTLKQLSDLAVALESASAHSPSALARVEQSLQTVMQAYAQSPVYKLATQNIPSYDKAETLYKNFKLLAKDLGTPGSALHWHLTRLLGLPADAGLKEAMTREVQQLGSGQTLASSRTQGKSLGVMVTGIKPLAPVEFFVGVSKAHANGVSISRTDKGARVEISMDDTRRLAASVASGLTLGRGAQAVGPGLRVAAEVTAAVARNTGSTISFDVKEADFPKMMSIIMGEQGNVYDLLALGQAHVAGKSSKNNVDLSLDGLAQLRLLYNPQEDIAELDTVIRAGFGVVGSLNVAHADNSQSTSRGATNISHSGGANLQLGRQGGVGVNVAPLNMVMVGIPGGGAPNVAAFALPEVSFMLKFDRTQSRGFSFSFKQPEPVTQLQIDGVVSSLSRYSPAFRQDLGALGLSGNTQGEQLTKLQQFLASHPPVSTKSEAYHVIVQLLDKLTHQQYLQQNGLRQLTSVEASVTAVGLRDDGQHAWLNDVAPANKAAIVQWLKDDPQFAQVLDQLQNGEGTSVRIGLELKPDVLHAIERKIIDGESPEPLIKSALSNRENLRIKSMSLSHTASQSHALSVPAMTNIGFSSNAGLSHTHKRVNADLEYGGNADKPLRMNLNDTLGSLPIHDLTIDLADLRVKAPKLALSGC